MPKVSEEYGGSGFLKAEDLKNKMVACTISGYEKMEFTDDKGQRRAKWVLEFHGKEKRLTLNKTNAQIIADMLGDEMDLWVGKTIKLYPDKTQFNGSMVDCVRVRKELPEATGDEEVPF